MNRNLHIDHLDGCFDIQVEYSTPSFYDDPEEEYSSYCFENEEERNEESRHLPVYRFEDPLKCVSIAPLIDGFQKKRRKLSQSPKEVGGIYKWYDIRVETCKEELELFKTLGTSSVLNKMVVKSTRGLHPSVHDDSDTVIEYKRETSKYLAHWMIRRDISMSIETLRNAHREFIKNIKACEREMQGYERVNNVDVSQYYMELYGIDFDENIGILKEWFNDGAMNVNEFVSMLKVICLDEYDAYIYACESLRDRYVNLISVRNSWIPQSYEDEEFINSTIMFDHFINMYLKLHHWISEEWINEDDALSSIPTISDHVEKLEIDLRYMLQDSTHLFDRQVNNLKEASRKCTQMDKYIVHTNAKEDLNHPIEWRGDSYQMKVWDMLRNFHRKRCKY